MLSLPEYALLLAGCGGCDGAGQVGFVPPNTASLHCPAGYELCSPLELAPPASS